jgi:hypothetical protein
MTRDLLLDIRCRKVLLVHDAHRPLRRLRRRRHVGILPIKDHSHLLQGVASCLRIVEERSETEEDEHHHEDNVVFPANHAQCDRVDERVEEDGEDGGDPCDGETSRSEGIRPDLAGISNEEGGAERIS